MSGISKRVSGSWVSGDYGIMKTATDTLTTLPAVLYPNATTATVGLKGNTVQSGTPSPDSPIMPQGTGERTGNLAYRRIDGANISPEGRIGRDSSSSVFDLAIARVEAGKVYTANTYVFAFYTDEPIIGSVSYDGTRNVKIPGQSSTFTAPITGYVAFRLSSGEQAMLNTGSTALPYEPYGIKIPISSASTTTPVYLGEVETTRKIKKLVLTGNEDWRTDVQAGHQVAFLSLNPIGIESSYNNPRGVCTHYPVEYNNTDGYARIMNNGTLLRIMDDSKAVDMATWTAFLAAQYAAGTPVCVWYVLATPETGIVNEPLMKVGECADTLSNVSIPVTAGGDTLSVGTTVQPSEVTVNYKGWHTGAVHERENGQWD